MIVINDTLIIMIIIIIIIIIIIMIMIIAYLKIMIIIIFEKFLWSFYIKILKGARISKYQKLSNKIVIPKRIQELAHFRTRYWTKIINKLKLIQKIK